MRMYDLIMKKRNGGILSGDEINEIIKGFVEGSIPDYQMSALLMAIYFQGMDQNETLDLTLALAASGDMTDLSGIEGIKADKHSTGGVGDKTTLIVAPIVAACGLKIAKMSGRGLGHTGGTVDKLESIPGLRTEFTSAEFAGIVNKTGLCIAGQSKNLAPGDKKLYALRDVTATVDSIPLIAASIMSKKLASGSDCIVLDVKTGSGAFMKSLKDSLALAKEMVAIGTNAGRKVAALITDMDIPLGFNIGNSLEVIEAVDVLNKKVPDDLYTVCEALSVRLLELAGKGSYKECTCMVKEALDTGAALEKLIEMVKAQGGDASYIKDTSKFKKAPYMYEVKSAKSGYIAFMDTEKIGTASTMLGAGRKTRESLIDYSAGIVLKKKYADKVAEGETVAVLYASDDKLFKEAEEKFISSIIIKSQKPEKRPLIAASISGNKEEEIYL